MKKMTKSFCALLFSIALLGLTTACSTMEGVGKDVQKAGKWIEKKAE